MSLGEHFRAVELFSAFHQPITHTMFETKIEPEIGPPDQRLDREAVKEFRANETYKTKNSSSIMLVSVQQQC